MGFGTITVNGAVSFEMMSDSHRRNLHLDDIELKYNEDGEHTLKLIKYYSDGTKQEKVVFETTPHSYET